MGVHQYQLIYRWSVVDYQLMSVQKWISNEVRYLTDSYIVNLFLVAGLAIGRNDGQSSEVNSKMINAYPLRHFGL